MADDVKRRTGAALPYGRQTVSSQVKDPQAIIQAQLISKNDDFRDYATLTSSNRYIARASAILLSLANKRENDDAVYDDYEAFLLEAYSPVNKHENIVQFAQDLQAMEEDDKNRRRYARAIGDLDEAKAKGPAPAADE